MYTATIESPLTEVYFNPQGCKIGGSCFISRLVTGQYISVQVGVHPVDTVKTRMQIQEPIRKLCKWKKGIVSKHIGIGPVGVDNWFFKGPSDLYRGVIGVILGTVPYALLYFSVYESTLFPIPGNSTSLDFQAWICKHRNHSVRCIHIDDAVMWRVNILLIFRMLAWNHRNGVFQNSILPHIVFFRLKIKAWEISANRGAACGFCFYGYCCSFCSAGDVSNLLPPSHSWKWLKCPSISFIIGASYAVVEGLQFHFHWHWRMSPSHHLYEFSMCLLMCQS